MWTVNNFTSLLTIPLNLLDGFLYNGIWILDMIGCLLHHCHHSLPKNCPKNNTDRKLKRTNIRTNGLNSADSRNTMTKRSQDVFQKRNLISYWKCKIVPKSQNWKHEYRLSQHDTLRQNPTFRQHKRMRRKESQHQRLTVIA